MRRTAAVLVASLLAAAMLALAGCTDDGGRQPAPPHDTGSPTTAPSKTGQYREYAEYAALGDSYTAAPLVPPTDLSTICLRSKVNYPALVARAMPGTRLTDVSCSGASTLNTDRGQVGSAGSAPPQFDALGPSTDLVTLGLGGNDYGLFATLLGRCTRLAVNHRTGSPCTAAAAADPGRTSALFDGIRHRLARVLAGVRQRSPHARILVIGYPQLVPASGTCDLLPLAAGDYRFARDTGRRLDSALRLAAADAHSEYVDLWQPSNGHDICSPDPWINGRVTAMDRALAYHPLAVEQRAVADLLLDRLR